jgi:hypothetical protein
LVTGRTGGLDTRLPEREFLEPPPDIRYYNWK